MGKQSHRLTRIQSLKFYDAFKARIEEFQNNKPTLRDAAKILSNDLGFNVTDKMVETLRRDLDIHWVSREKKPDGTRIPYRLVETTLLEVTEAVVQLVSDLKGHANVPDSLAAKAKRLQDYLATKE